MGRHLKCACGHFKTDHYSRRKDYRTGCKHHFNGGECLCRLDQSDIERLSSARCSDCLRSGRVLNHMGKCMRKAGCQLAYRRLEETRTLSAKTAALRQAGLSFKEIGKELGCTRQRAQYLWARWCDRFAPRTEIVEVSGEKSS